MASLRKGGDREAARRGTPTAPSGTIQRVRPSSSSSSRPSSMANSPDKEHPAAAKLIPNYLKPTLSSKSPDVGDHSKANTDTTTTKRLARIKSMEKSPGHHLHLHPQPQPHPARTIAATGVKSSASALKSSLATSPSTRVLASSSRAVTDRTCKSATKSSVPGVTKVRTAAVSATRKKKESGSSASSSPIAAAAHHQDATEEGPENAEPKTIMIITDPASPSAQEEHHEEAENHGFEEENHSPGAEDSHDPFPEPEEESHPVPADSPPRDVAQHQGSPKIDATNGGRNIMPAFEGQPAEYCSISSQPVPATETNNFLTRSRTVPSRPKPSEAAKIPVDDELQRKLMSRKAWETGSGADSTSQKDGGDNLSGPGFKRQDTLGKEESPAYNDVIEETTSKLNGKSKNKVLALAGAFETVISLQEPKTLQSGTQSPATAPAGGSGAGETHMLPAAVLAEGDKAANSTVNGDTQQRDQ